MGKQNWILTDINVLDMIAKSKESNTQKIKKLEREIESLKNLLAK